MKRFFGTILAIIGGIATLWGGYHCITGGTERILYPLPVQAMHGGLIGITCMIFGFFWVRD
jgi:hypothetical protein